MRRRKSAAAGKIGSKKEGNASKRAGHGRYMPCGDAKACLSVGGVEGRGGAVEVAGESGGNRRAGRRGCPVLADRPQGRRGNVGWEGASGASANGHCSEA
jgi:hypothetical protein